MALLKIDSNEPVEVSFKGTRIVAPVGVSELITESTSYAVLDRGDGVKMIFDHPRIQITENLGETIVFRLYARPEIEKVKTDPTIRKVAEIVAQMFTEEQALQVRDIFNSFAVGVTYTEGTYFIYDGNLYKANQTHKSQAQWLPGTVGTESLYTKVTLNESGYPVWKQPTGAHDAYNKGDVVEYNGELYISRIDGNTYSPDAYPDGWEKYIEE